MNNDSFRSGTAGGSNGRGDRDHYPRGQDAGAPNPSDLLPALDERQLSVLRLVGREWDRVSGDPAAWREALPVDPALGSYPDPTEIRPTRFGRFVRVSLQNGQLPAVEATSAAEVPPLLLGRLGYDLRRIVLGAPLKSPAIAHERMRKLVALPVLSADALSSVAYGPEAMLAILVLGGSAAFGYALPIATVIAFLMLAVGVSYRQTIRAYPHGGGSYIVASDNLGRVPGLVAAAGLLTDYILTVAVSLASGVAAITSAIPPLASATVPIGVGVIAVLLAGNMRGVRQAGVLFAAPTYAFIFAIFTLVAVGLYHAADRGFHPTPTPPLTAMEGVSVLLLLRLCLGVDGHDWHRGHLQRGAGVPARRVAQCPHNVNVDGRPADRAVRRHDRAGPSRRRSAKCARDRPLAARPSQLRLGIHVRFHAGGDGGNPAAGGEHRL